MYFVLYTKAIIALNILPLIFRYLYTFILLIQLV